MQFSVIYSVDVPEDEDISRYFPPDLDLWDQTEGEDARHPLEQCYYQ